MQDERLFRICMKLNMSPTYRRLARVPLTIMHKLASTTPVKAIRLLYRMAHDPFMEEYKDL